jgi:hypothetical protein
LEAVANALLEKETIDGAEVGRLVDLAFGRPVPAAHAKPEAPHADVPDDPPMPAEAPLGQGVLGAGGARPRRRS